ncbi:cbb3-type cytochrome c oxidase N-terminal domain-containing protein [Reichenbachiella ulvae]|uniref:C-type cytochrome n=1 Tax=Reichenbachiella ulvae TaxID=2980104 RepID=A0ABT3CRM1_9BACT|nr:cbb3-type cytochrome c oxidase N-terminal domain-containing protein [Reichenbachiella ulvae]MCV9386257.1 c-type cytochrome [Reichenbachiella ulvae]
MKIFNSIYIKSLLAFVLLITGTLPSQAQDTGMSISSDDVTLIALGLILLIVILVLVVAIFLLKLIQTLLDKELEAKGIIPEAEPSWWQKLDRNLTNAVPLEEEESIELDHDYDGIKELDNHLPPWWKWLFYLSIVFAVYYMIDYHVLESSPLSAEEYEIAMKEAEEAKASSAGEEESIDESNIVFNDDPELLAKGKTIYVRNCVACHKENGEGGIGPNLADKYWLHGGSIQDTYNTISNGVVEKGMIAWKEVLSPSNINAVNSYIYTLRGTNPANPKAPQGEVYEAETKNTEESESVESDSTALAE